MSGIKKKCRIPYWERSSAKLNIGLEQEHFIFSKERLAPSLDQIKGVFEGLLGSGFIARKVDTDGRPLTVNQDLGAGYVSVKNDYATHIIEAAFPPISTPSELKSLYEDTWGRIRFEAKKNGLFIENGALISTQPPNFELISNVRSSQFLNRNVPDGIPGFSNKYLPSLVCSTQLHLNILDEKFYSELPLYYSFEFLVPLLFSNSKTASPRQAHCMRLLLWQQYFEPDYKAFAIPLSIPRNHLEYQNFLESSQNFVRDYCYIAPRTFDTVEFRAACSQDNIDKILQLSALRFATAVAVEKKLLKEESNIQTNFIQACAFGKVSNDLLDRTMFVLSEVHSLLPSEWQAHLERFLAAVQESKELGRRCG